MTTEIITALVAAGGVVTAAAIPLIHKRRTRNVAAMPATTPRPTPRTAAAESWTPRPRRHRSLGTASTGPSESYPIVNISETGALLETRGEIAVGRELDILLELGGETARVTASVVRIQQPGWGRVGGVGVLFVHCDDRSEKLIRNHIYSEPPQEAHA